MDYEYSIRTAAKLIPERRAATEITIETCKEKG